MAVPVGELLAHALTGWEATTEGYLWAEVLVSTLLFAPVACSARRAWVIPAAFVVGTLCTLAVYHPGLSAAMALNAGAVSVAALGGLIGKAIERR